MKTIELTAGLILNARSGKQRRFKILAYSGGTLLVSGFPLPVVLDLQGLSVPPSIPILMDHQATVESTLGSTDDIQNDGFTLNLAGVVTGQSVQAKQVIKQHDAGHKWQASIGASVEETVTIPVGVTVRVNGQTFSGPVIVAKRSQLEETSILPMGADSTTTVNLAAAAQAAHSVQETTMPNQTFEEFTEALGVDTETLTAQGTALLQAQYDASQGNGDNLTTMKATASDFFRYQAEIQAKAAGHPEIAATAIENNWSVDRVELEVLKASSARTRPTSFTSAHRSGGLTENALSASLMIRAGHEELAVQAFGGQTCETARAARITNLVDLAAAALQLSGKDRNSYSSHDKMIQAAFSTSSLPNILSTTMNRTLENAYEETTSDWRKFCNIASAANFRTQTGIRPAAIEGLDPLGNGGVIKHGKIGEEATYQWAIGTFAKMLAVTRTDMVNDDLKFLDELAPMLGMAAGRSLKDLIWSTILGAQDAGYFSVGNANLGEAGSALDVGSLGAAIQAMKSQRDSQGFDIDIQPQALVVGPSLELTARNLLKSAELLAIATESQPNGNPVQGIVPHLVVEPRLANSTRFENTSATQWMLFGGPRTKPITVGFLNGMQSPTVDIQDADFDKLGVQMRVYHDYGCALGDPKAAYKATGAAEG